MARHRRDARRGDADPAAGEHQPTRPCADPGADHAAGERQPGILETAPLVAATWRRLDGVRPLSPGGERQRAVVTAQRIWRVLRKPQRTLSAQSKVLGGSLYTDRKIRGNAPTASPFDPWLFSRC